MPLKLHQDELPSINLTSMIDVLFLLIIFFMVGTRFTENESTIAINVPKVAPSGAMLQPPNAKTVTVHADGSIRFEGQTLTLDQLTATLVHVARSYPDMRVQVKPDAKVQMDRFAEVVTSIRNAGVPIEGLTLASYQMPTQRR